MVIQLVIFLTSRRFLPSIHERLQSIMHGKDATNWQRYFVNICLF